MNHHPLCHPTTCRYITSFNVDHSGALRNKSTEKKQTTSVLCGHSPAGQPAQPVQDFNPGWATSDSTPEQFVAKNGTAVPKGSRSEMGWLKHACP